MKKSTICAVALAAATFTSAAQAGSLADPVVEEPVVVTDAEGSSSGTAMVAMLAVLLAIPALGD
ncbi:hypothetical protein JQV27_03320 [Sulfitobacter mediterraneus]|jgi:hypothetical protein|uniref:hypothetical protein n=1 Tax=Sulfitobacter TaxID=60136 RepID=UPI001932C97E|nr:MULTISPECIES: hypothetical protein [Sulfitobacter]MBM1631855.1 hypothetical protein [Sulfitobacter mediterraneus]MBM1639670.1 hypothetical protein [Sulfitobacter mediterraneus]MBM1643719.1 hypothetical protein [Sulfitobacter mediterraneus]MBM1647765.1 hypothetical protein [Sulfitobacter mediterraneus]MBM1651810.1 hypothetical protein [Sulfitobacter mediterraneus]